MTDTNDHKTAAQAIDDSPVGRETAGRPQAAQTVPEVGGEQAAGEQADSTSSTSASQDGAPRIDDSAGFPDAPDWDDEANVSVDSDVRAEEHAAERSRAHVEQSENAAAAREATAGDADETMTEVEMASDDMADGQIPVSPSAPQAGKAADEAVGVKTSEVAFSQLALNPALQSALARMNFSHCTPIQAQTLPVTLTGQDLIGQAQTGTGKTAAFLLTILERILSRPIALEDRFASEPRAVVIAPTRELALQIEKDARQLSRGINLNIVTLIGGTQVDRFRKRLREEALDLVIATPGRLIDHISSRDLFLDQVEIMVLDEADRMLDMGFIPDVKRIVRLTPRGRQTLLFSATFSEDIMELARRWTQDPAEVLLAVDNLQAATNVEQRVYMVESSQKLNLLVNLLKSEELSRVIVFCNRRDQTRAMNETLAKNNIPAEMISGELPQARRQKALEQFRAGRYRVLVATDVAGRGIHIEGVSHVINFHLPEDPEDYVHRIGRTGRAGASGVSISFACEDDSFMIPELEAYLGKKLELTHPDESLLGNP
ncbi:DEAD/DEAH box helicase [Allohahella marinimesophila]|uniref:ATP-dependent RNA helicase RhlB n=1 Tax=Allohahella marinimesophila TaxID=1054972 RepID=A0ABP7NM99_9GAMM